jgi:tetratricopeptide (TPR) repeat protein
MGFNTNKPATPAAEKQNAERIAAAIACLRQGRNAQAFLLLSEPGACLEKEPAARYALALCHLRAADLAPAISCMEQALHLLRAMSAPAWGALEINETYLRLAAGQIVEEVYLAPVDADFCVRFPTAAEQTVLLALIYIYQKKGVTEHAQRLAASLTGPVFEEFKKKLAGNRMAG